MFLLGFLSILGTKDRALFLFSQPVPANRDRFIGTVFPIQPALIDQKLACEPGDVSVLLVSVGLESAPLLYPLGCFVADRTRIVAGIIAASFCHDAGLLFPSKCPPSGLDGFSYTF